MTFYSDMAATATSLLTTYGQTMTLRRVSGGTFNPATGAVSGESSSDVSGVGVFIQRSQRITEGFGNVENGDRFAILDSTQAPDPSTDKLLVGSETWTIVEVMPIDPAGTPVAYKLQVRK